MNNQHISENKKQNEWPINAKESWLHVWKLEYANLKVDRFTDHEANLSGSIGPSATSTFSMELPADSKYLRVSRFPLVVLTVIIVYIVQLCHLANKQFW